MPRPSATGRSTKQNKHHSVDMADIPMQTTALRNTIAFWRAGSVLLTAQHLSEKHRRIADLATDFTPRAVQPQVPKKAPEHFPAPPAVLMHALVPQPRLNTLRARPLALWCTHMHADRACHSARGIGAMCIACMHSSVHTACPKNDIGCPKNDIRRDSLIKYILCISRYLLEHSQPMSNSTKCASLQLSVHMQEKEHQQVTATLCIGAAGALTG